MKTSKRLFSIIMAAFMLIGVVSAGLTAFAVPPSLQDLIDAAGDGATVTLPAQWTESVVIENKNITLDLKGRSLSGDFGQSAITVKNGNVTIKNGQVYSFFAKVSSAEMLSVIGRSDNVKPTIDILSGSVSIIGLFVNGMQVRVPTTADTYSYAPVGCAVSVKSGAALTVEKGAFVGLEWALDNAAGSQITVVDGAFAGLIKGIRRESAVVFDSTATSMFTLVDKVDSIFPNVTLEPSERKILTNLLDKRVICYVKNAVPDVSTTYDDGTLTVTAKADLSNIIERQYASYKWIPEYATVGGKTKKFDNVPGTDKYVAVFEDVPPTAPGVFGSVSVRHRLWLGLNEEEIYLHENIVSIVQGVYAKVGPFINTNYPKVVNKYNSYIGKFAKVYYDLDTLAAQPIPGTPSKTFGDIEAFKNLQIDLYLIGGKTMYDYIKDNIDADYEYNDYNICTYLFGIELGQTKLLDEIDALKAALEEVDFSDYVDLAFFFYDNYQDILDVIDLAEAYGGKLVTDLNDDMASDIIDALASLGNSEITEFVGIVEQGVSLLERGNRAIGKLLNHSQVQKALTYLEGNAEEAKGHLATVLNVIENFDNYYTANVVDGWLKLYSEVTQVDYQAFTTVKTDISVNGTGKVEYASEHDSGETINGVEAQYYPNSNITLSAVTTTPDIEFLFWVNSDTNRILSTNQEFTLATNISTRVEAVFNDASFGNQVVYTNTTGDIAGVEFYSPEDDYVYITDAIPQMPRYAFVGWPHASSDDFGNAVIMLDDLSAFSSPFAGALKTSAFDEASDKYQNAIVPVREGSGNFVVVPDYKIDGVVNISYFDGSAMKQVGYGLYADAAITAVGENFSYWVNDNDEIVSLYRTFQFKAVQDNFYTAVFDAATIPDAVISITGIYRDAANDQVTFYAERSSKYTVTRNGVVLTFDEDVAENGAAFVPGGQNVLTGTAKHNTLEGNYAVTKTSYTGAPIYARAYIEIEYPNGQRKTLYSDVVSFSDISIS